MPDYIGPIEVPEQSPSGTFPLTVEYPLVVAHAPKIYIHQFSSGSAKIEQRFLAGTGARRWTIRCQMSYSQRAALTAFWDARKGAYQPFTLNLPKEDGSGTTAVTVRFADGTLTVQQASDALATTGLDVIEVVSSTPSYPISATLERLPDAVMESGLLDQVQTLIPLMRIVPVSTGTPIYLSDRRVTVGADTYLPRLLTWSGISQSIGGATDEASFTFGNADRVMTELAKAVDLWKARVEFAIYHVESGRKLDLWAGYCSEYSYDEGEQFWLSASDGLYELNIAYPTRKATRQCWKTYKDGLHCTASSVLPDCDKSWDNCVARSNTNQFGGILTVQEGVRIKDNSTGFAGLGRNTITATSILSENIYGRPLKQVFTDSDMPVEADIVAARDESEFFSALGVVGEGPIGAYGTGHLLDNQPHHGPGNLGLRTSLGSAPSNSDLFNLDETSGGEAPYRAAGTAFVQIRRTDEKGIQPSRPETHSMQVVVRQGLSGWVWSAPGSRSAQVLTNPIWVAVNVYLRALRLEHASASVQELFFDVGAAIAAANICNTTVTALVGSGSVTQFKFQGVIADEKPVRDWLQEILNNCLGYYTFRNGRLWLGIRLHSGSAEGGAYGTGNILMGSLRTARRAPQFNHLTISYADKQKKFAANSVLFYDEDHIAEHGELKGSINLVGTATADQALRIATVRLREELGGVDASEWKNSRTISFRTTVLGLKTTPGQVCSLTHPDVPGGTCEFRLTSWRLNADWTIDYEGVTTTDAMYDLLVGPKPGDVVADPPPGEETPMPLIGCWHPGYETPGGSDPLFDPSHKRFTLRQGYEQMADGVSICRLLVEGYLPVTRFVTETRPRLSDVSVSGTGGSLKASTDYYLQVAAYDANGKLSPPSLALRVTTPAGANTCKLDIGHANWPSGTWAGYKVYLSDNPHLVCEQATVAGALPSSFSVTSHTHTSSVGVPIPGRRPRVRVKVKRLIHAGIIGTNLAAVGPNYLELGPGIITADDEFNGRICSVIADNDGEADIWNFEITDTVLSTNRLVVTPNPASLGITAQDVLVIRTKATTFNSTQLGDAKWTNGQYPGGLANDETGTLLRIIGGTGKGQVRRVIGNSTTVHTVDRPFNPVPDATSIWIIEEGTWVHQAESSPVDNELPTALLKMPVEVGNYEMQSLLVLATLITENAESSEQHSPWREIYVYGQDALVPGGAPTIDPVTAVALTSPPPAGWAANPDYFTAGWAPFPQAMVALDYTPPSDPDFTGVDVWMRLSTDPDDKAQRLATATYTGPGTGKVEVFFERPDDDGTYLFHLASRSRNAVNKPDFSDSAATEAVALVGRHTLTAAVSGTTMSVIYYTMEEGEFWGINANIPLPSSNPSWTWITLWVQHVGVDAAPRKVASWPRSESSPIFFAARDWGIPFDDEPNKTFRFTLTLTRLDATEVLQSNPWGNGTPNRDFTVQRQAGSAGAEYAPNIVLNAAATIAETGYNVDGVAIVRFKAEWALPPSKGKFGGFDIYLSPEPINLAAAVWLGRVNATSGTWVSEWIPHPPPGNYHLVFLMVDPRGRRNSYQSGVTPAKAITLGTPSAGVLLSRTKGKLEYVGTQSPFEGIEVKAQNGLLTQEVVAKIGAAVEDASTLDLAVTAGNITCRVANIAPYVGLEGRFLRLLHTNNVTYERFRVLSINQATRVITMDYGETGNVSFLNSYPVGSKVQIDFPGAWFKNLWVGGTGVQDAPLYVDTGGNLMIESRGGRHPALQINKNGIYTQVANTPNTELPSSVVDGVRVQNATTTGNYASLSMYGTVGVRQPEMILQTQQYKRLFARYNDTEGGAIEAYDLVAGLVDFVLSGNRTNPGGLIPGSPGVGLRSYIQAGSLVFDWMLIYRRGGLNERVIVTSTGDVNGQYVKHRHFPNSYSGTMVKADMLDGEIATWWDGSNFHLVVKAGDGSGNTFRFTPAGTL